MADTIVVDNNDIILYDALDIFDNAVKKGDNLLTLELVSHTPEAEEILQRVHNTRLTLKIVRKGYLPISNPAMTHQTLKTLDWTEEQKPYGREFRAETVDFRVQIEVIEHTERVHIYVYAKRIYKAKNPERTILYTNPDLPLQERLDDLVAGINNMERKVHKYDNAVRTVRKAVGLY